MSTYRQLGNQNQVQLRIRDWLVSIGFVLNCLACLFALVAGESQVSGCGTYRLLIRCIIVSIAAGGLYCCANHCNFARFIATTRLRTFRPCMTF
jgi:hypothetical protein